MSHFDSPLGVNTAAPEPRPKAGIPTDADVQRASELAREIPQDEDLDGGVVPCVRCKRLCDPDEMNCPDEGLMCESCFDAKYGG